MSHPPGPAPPLLPDEEEEKPPFWVIARDFLLGTWIGRLLLVGILLAALSPLARPAYRALKAWRVGQLIRVARKADAEGEVARALQELRRAWSLAPEVPALSRAIAEHYRASDPRRAAAFLRTLLETGDATREDRVAFVRAALGGGLRREAAKELDRLLAEPGADADRSLAQLEVEVRAPERDPRVVQAARRCVALAPDPHAREQAEILLAAMLTGVGPGPEQRDEAVRILDALTRQDGSPQTHEAATALARIYLGSPQGTLAVGRPRAERVAEMLRLSADAPLDEFLAACELRVELARPDAAASERVLDAAQAVVGSRPEADQLEFARWLTRTDRHTRCVAFSTSRPGAARHQEWFLVRLDALAGLGKWDEIDRALAGAEGLPLEEPFRLLFRFRASRELSPASGGPTEAWHDLERALRTAPDEQILYCARYLERIREHDRAGRLYRRIAEKPHGALANEGWLGLARCQMAAGASLGDLRATLAELARRYPDNAQVENDRVFFDLLAGASLGDAIAAAHRLVEGRGGTLAHEITAALAELRDGKPKAAIQRLDRLRVVWDHLSVPWRVVRCAALQAAGRGAEAAAMARTLRGEPVRPEEWALLTEHGLAQPP